MITNLLSVLGVGKLSTMESFNFHFFLTFTLALSYSATSLTLCWGLCPSSATECWNDMVFQYIQHPGFPAGMWTVCDSNLLFIWNSQISQLCLSHDPYSELFGKVPPGNTSFLDQKVFGPLYLTLFLKGLYFYLLNSEPSVVILCKLLCDRLYRWQPFIQVSASCVFQRFHWK